MTNFLLIQVFIPEIPQLAINLRQQNTITSPPNSLAALKEPGAVPSCAQMEGRSLAVVKIFVKKLKQCFVYWMTVTNKYVKIFVAFKLNSGAPADHALGNNFSTIIDPFSGSCGLPQTSILGKTGQPDTSLKYPVLRLFLMIDRFRIPVRDGFRQGSG